MGWELKKRLWRQLKTRLYTTDKHCRNKDIVSLREGCSNSGLWVENKDVETTEDSEDQVIHYRQTLPKQGYCFPEGCSNSGYGVRCRSQTLAHTSGWTELLWMACLGRAVKETNFCATQAAGTATIRSLKLHRPCQFQHCKSASWWLDFNVLSGSPQDNQILSEAKAHFKTLLIDTNLLSSQICKFHPYTATKHKYIIIQLFTNIKTGFPRASPFNTALVKKKHTRLGHAGITGYSNLLISDF